ncbi:HNH endonuclease [Halarcobacter ebronensis]|uniref:HNH endonuclease n=1 Tax=Halarcobacter ebronensis TaxID=1462615 RepID=A0A4Q1AF05_9BACT|nr:HNH endonuclease [Halarcobacter ebronensis]QKF82654.1 hypothetical protein AEBR_2180 [Halarcobacter ebronensis]RXK02077.1 hypothetical protein CRV07_14280 [Halarcobacter ebronensis]
MVLDVDFIIASLLVILTLIPLYIYRKEIYKKFSRSGNTETFIKDVKVYLQQNYPKIQFDFSVLNKHQNEKDVKLRELMIVEELARQFAYFEYELHTQKDTSKDMHWSGYEQNSILQKDNKLPPDWAQRKSVAWKRDNGKCNRCGTQISLPDANALFAKQMRDGGGFNLENIVILCNDCSKIIKSSNLEKTIKDLPLLDKLIKKVDNF